VGEVSPTGGATNFLRNQGGSAGRDRGRWFPEFSDPASLLWSRLM